MGEECDWLLRKTLHLQSQKEYDLWPVTRCKMKVGVILSSRLWDVAHNQDFSPSHALTLTLNGSTHSMSECIWLDYIKPLSNDSQALSKPINICLAFVLDCCISGTKTCSLNLF